LNIDVLKRYYIHSYEEILEKIKRRMESLEVPSPPKKHGDRIGKLKTLYLKRLELVYNILNSEIDRVIETLSVLSKTHKFYQELFMIRTGRSPGEYRRLYIGKKKILRRLYSRYRITLKTINLEYELKIRYREAIGRLLSVLKRHKRIQMMIKEAVRELSKMPSIREDELKVIVAGMPQVGKSTLVSKLSTAEPEIAQYPFTTKTIIVGHLIREPCYRIAFIDTPGLLDRPLSERNVIELKAVLALKYLADKTVYLIDASPNSYYTLDEQYRVLEDVLKISGEEIIVCINKIDITPKDRIEHIKKTLSEKYGINDVLEISALKSIGLDKLLEKIIPKDQALQHI